MAVETSDEQRPGRADVLMAFRDRKAQSVPHTAQTAHPVVWHYTSAHGLLGIAQAGELWASSPLALNDLSELSHGMGIIREAWKRVRAEQATAGGDSELMDIIDSIVYSDMLLLKDFPFYYLCASKVGDSTSQWMHYSRPQGYAVGIDTHAHLAPVYEGAPPKGEPSRTVGGPVFSGWYDVVYNRDKQLDMATRLLDFHVTHQCSTDFAVEMSVRWYLGTLASRFKHDSFSAEAEVRYITTRHRSHKEMFRVGPTGIVPYLRLRAAPERGGHGSPRLQPHCRFKRSAADPATETSGPWSSKRREGWPRRPDTQGQRLSVPKHRIGSDAWRHCPRALPASPDPHDGHDPFRLARGLG